MKRNSMSSQKSKRRTLKNPRQRSEARFMDGRHWQERAGAMPLACIAPP
jgi:hypothetical protein